VLVGIPCVTPVISNRGLSQTGSLLFGQELLVVCNQGYGVPTDQRTFVCGVDAVPACTSKSENKHLSTGHFSHFKSLFRFCQWPGQKVISPGPTNA
jgi:hypothetical protein